MPIGEGSAEANAKIREKNNLVKKRGTVKSVITRYLNEVKTELSLPDSSIAALQSGLAQLKPREKELRKYDEALADILEGDEYTVDATVASDYYCNYLDLLDRAQRKIDEIRHRPPPNHNGNGQNQGGQPTPMAPTVRLPKLEIKKFSGSYREWPSFWSHFKGTIHNSQLEKRDKFEYLNSYLEGEAARSIQGLDATDVNYDSAIEILDNRFNKKGLILGEHLDKITRLTQIQSSSDVGALKRLNDMCEIEIRSLKSLGVSSEKYNTLFGHLIYGRLPGDLAVAYTRENRDEAEINVDNLLKFLRNEIFCRERAFAVNHPEKDRRPTERSRNDSRSHRPNPQPPSAAALTVGVQQPRPCAFCDDPTHSPAECQKFTATERREIASKKRYCFICLKNNHQANRCNLRTRRSCRLCNRKHHVSLCDADQAKTGYSKRQNETPSQNNPPLVPVQTSNGGGSGSSTTGVQLSSITREGTILLQTALILAESTETGKVSPIRCLLDPGAHRSFIKQDVSRNLGLQVVGEEELDVYGFESSDPVKVKRRRVRIIVGNLRDPRKRITMEALETPSVTGAVFAVPGDDIRRRMEARGLPMADAAQLNGLARNASTLDLLIGTEFYWQIMTTDTVQRFTESLVAINSLFGWVVHGPTSVGATPVGVNTVAIMPFHANVKLRKHACLNNFKRFGK